MNRRRLPRRLITIRDHTISKEHWRRPPACGLLSARRSASIPGRGAATVIGALGGAALGNQVGQQMNAPGGYRIDVRLSDGSMRGFDVPGAGDWQPGDRVRIDGGNRLSRY